MPFFFPCDCLSPFASHFAEQISHNLAYSKAKIKKIAKVWIFELFLPDYQGRAKVNARVYSLISIFHKGNMNANDCVGESPQLNRWEDISASEI